MNITIISDANWLSKIQILFPDLPISVAIRQAAMSALDNNLKAKPFTMTSGASTIRTPVALMTSHESKIKRYAVEHCDSASHAALVSFLANAWLFNSTREVELNQLSGPTQWYDDVLLNAGMNKRKEQELLITHLNEAAVSGQQCSLHEASTGVGKTLALVLSAVNNIREGTFTRIVIAVPTQTILKQFEVLLLSLNLPTDVRIGVARARTSYLSHFACLEMIEDANTPPATKEKLAQLLAEGNYRASELAEYENEIPIDDLLLQPEYHEDDPGGAQYEKERQFWSDYHVLITTHSMIAFDSLQRRKAIHQMLKSNDQLITFTEYTQLLAVAKRKGDVLLPRYIYINTEHFKHHSALIEELDKSNAQLLPYYDGLMIDEAHQFPEMVSLSLQNNISLYSLMLLSKKAFALKNITKAQFQNFHDLWDDAKWLASSADADGRLVISKSAPDSKGLFWINSVLAYASEIKKIIKKCGKSTNPHSRRFMWQMNEFISIVERFNEYSTLELDFSPVQKYPRITSYGSNDLALAIMHFSWIRAKHTAYVSATLSLSNGGIGDYMDAITRLAIDKTKAKSFPPIMADWLFKDVSVYLHHADSAETTKTKLKDDASTSDSRHFEKQAEIILNAQQRQAGGSLVLCTSFTAIRQLHSLLSKNDIAVICSSPDRSTNRCIEEYIERYQAGDKVVWLATGAAWLGLDVSDRDALPENDHLIQNLFIQQLPYPSRNEGNKNHSFLKQQADALLKFKQGIGRLVRRPGRKGMEIHVLDGRIHDRVHSRFIKLFEPYSVVHK